MFMNFMKEMTMGKQHWMTGSYPDDRHSSNMHMVQTLYTGRGV